MPKLTAAEVAAICGGTVTGAPSAVCDGFGADTRTLNQGTGFVAIRSGRSHVAEALASGAPYAIVEQPDSVPAGATAVVVPDVTVALSSLATEVSGRLGARVVGITGSVGKTLTRNFIAAALGAAFKVHESPGNFNNDWGLPLTILSCPDDAQALVVELGARGPGEIARLCRIARPEIGVITGIGSTHIEVFGTREAIARTKSELLASLPAGGLAVVPATDDYLDLLSASTAARVVTVGPGGHVWAETLELDEDGRPVALLRLEAGRRVVVKLPLPGRPLVRNAAMAVRVAVELGVEPEAAAGAIAMADTTSHRLQVMSCGDITVIDDAYNASPSSTAAALRTTVEIAAGRPAWAVLGEMAELGHTAEAEHVRIGRLAASLGFDRVLAVGRATAALAEAAGDVCLAVEDAKAAAEVVSREAPAGAVVLVKGSRVAGLDVLPSLLARVGPGA